MTLLVISPVGMLDLRDLKFHCLRISIGRQTIDNRASRIPKPQEFRYLIESLPGRVVAGVSDVLIGPKTLVLVCQIKMGVATGHDQSQHREIEFSVTGQAAFEQDGVNVSLEMIDRDQRLIQGKR